MNFAKRLPDLLLPIGIILCLMVIFVPLPPGVMDLLLAANITVAVMLLLSTVYVKTPLELSVFPSLLLGTTLARLALNVATTRLILTQGAVDGDSAAGGVIQSFSQFVTGDNLAVGIVIFSIIVVIQFVVITKGATRISEVSARFALDGLPGRQMAIDADLNAGLIDSQKAQTLRSEVVEHADFYGAMDGASKFVRGDAIAGVIITLINIAGGLAIGLSSSMSIGEATTTFTKLTIGDGLASQVPALLISLAAGLLVTRSSRKTNLPRESVNQVFARPIVLVITAVFLGLMILTDLPKIPLMLISLGCLGAAYSISRTNKQKAEKAINSTPVPAAPPRATEATIDKLLSNDILEMELGVGLIKLADSRQGGQLLAGVTQVRKEIAAELGVILPKTRIRDNLEIGPNEFRIRIQGNIVQRGEIQPDHSLAIDDGRATGPLGEGAVRGFADEHLSSSPAYWIDANAAEESKGLGYHVLEATEVLATLLKSISIENASYLLTRDATKQLVDEIAKTSPALVSELIPDVMSLAKVQQVLKGLISEGISIRPLPLILESLSDHASEISNRWDLTEKVRVQLSRHIISKLTQESGNSIQVFTISPEIEKQISTAWHRENDEIRINLPREIIENLAGAIQNAAQQMRDSGIKPIALVDQSIRPVIAELAFDNASNMFVLGRQEAMGAEVEVVGEISSEELHTVAQAA
ncbi:flagellar biosynthesis protein FlhA [bacterium]|nr:flagellar biosynthesis protein FlhA [bacterium]MDC0311393.1 flagellar biosynthesis protein FlhA [bacterium]|eukprot:COSAG01_NODE_5399_length_4287_cov_35.844733_2_plen_700_part_00